MELSKTPIALPLPKGIEAGQKFSDLTVVERVPSDAHGRIRLLCTCICGKQCEVRFTDLKSGHTQSCGCKRDRSLRHKFGKIVLTRFGQFTAFGKANEERGVTKSTQWVVVCAYCKKFAIATTSELRRGRKRCPCVESTYRSWRNMIQRCTNPKHEQYGDNYGGKGIYVCEEWRKSFQTFLRDMGPRPEGKTLDRRDPNGPYAPGNCRWATPEQQAQNRNKPVVRNNSSGGVGITA